MNPERLSDLANQFPKEAISWRAQSLTKDGAKAMALAYIDARDVMDRLDEVCGLADWQDRYEFHGSRTVCYLSIRVGDEWITKADGAGDSDIEGEKGAISDALKRAAVKWGIGRYLYSIDAPWVPCETAEWNGKKHWKRWTDDPWKYVKAFGPPPRSAASLKRTDDNGDDDWDRLTKELDQDLLDCKGSIGLSKLRADYRAKAIDRRWPKDWLQALAGKFEEAEARLAEEDDTFPGDTPSRDDIKNNKYAQAVMVG